MTKSLKKLALPPLLLLAAAGGAWALRPEAEPQGPWADFADGCATFDGARIAFTFDDDRLGETRAFYLHASAHGAIGLDEFNGYNTRYAWSQGKPLTKHWRNQPSPRVVSNAATYIEDLWDECRMAFSSSIWHYDPVPTAMAGYSKVWNWARLELPFDWAGNVPVWVAAEVGSGKLARIVVDQPGEPLVVNVAEVTWEAEVNPDQLSASSPAVGPPRPTFFRTGRSVEDIRPDGPPLEDVSPPVWSPTVAKPNCISHPNGDLVRLDLYDEIVPEVWDPAGAAVRIVRVQSSEPDANTGPGDKPNDIRFNGNTVCVRGERTSNTAARLYTITLEAKDGYGNIANTNLTVTVPGGRTPCASQQVTTVPDRDPSCQL